MANMYKFEISVSVPGTLLIKGEGIELEIPDTKDEIGKFFYRALRPELSWLKGYTEQEKAMFDARNEARKKLSSEAANKG